MFIPEISSAYSIPKDRKWSSSRSKFWNIPAKEGGGHLCPTDSVLPYLRTILAGVQYVGPFYMHTGITSVANTESRVIHFLWGARPPDEAFLGLGMQFHANWPKITSHSTGRITAHEVRGKVGYLEQRALFASACLLRTSLWRLHRRRPPPSSFATSWTLLPPRRLFCLAVLAPVTLISLDRIYWYRTVPMT